MERERKKKECGYGSNGMGEKGKEREGGEEREGMEGGRGSVDKDVAGRVGTWTET